mmetsp:Transcript_73771/g.240296  ORF Transcript_73771/g.240296 Transcript_73771/m.240296 type:complete len:222 (+) Transcript_73771:1203-1868(+)
MFGPRHWRRRRGGRPRRRPMAWARPKSSRSRNRSSGIFFSRRSMTVMPGGVRMFRWPCITRPWQACRNIWSTSRRRRALPLRPRPLRAHRPSGRLLETAPRLQCRRRLPPPPLPRVHRRRWTRASRVCWSPMRGTWACPPFSSATSLSSDYGRALEGVPGLRPKQGDGCQFPLRQPYARGGPRRCYGCRVGEGEFECEGAGGCGEVARAWLRSPHFAVGVF